MSAPCGGCPPHCKVCIFASQPDAATRITTEVVLPADVYGCVRPDGGDVVLGNGRLGMMRGQGFHPVTNEGAAFLRHTGNGLAVHL